ncbi:MAG: TetR/AcrR family transcriptional regulator [Stackebrandtia sp.]
MPKVVDAGERRELVADALFRIVARDGLHRASVRGVAAEAGLNPGSVRHYFADHADVMAFAMKELANQTAQRILAHAKQLVDPPPGFDRRAFREAIFAEFLPLDEQRELEVVVWLEFSAAARTDPRLREYAAQVHNGERMIIERILRRTYEAGRMHEPIDIPLETERLAALLDGLAMNLVQRPDRLDAATALAVLRRHLDTLLRDDVA